MIIHLAAIPDAEGPPSAVDSLLQFMHVDQARIPIRAATAVCAVTPAPLGTASTSVPSAGAGVAAAFILVRCLRSGVETPPGQPGGPGDRFGAGTATADAVETALRRAAYPAHICP
eukprot:COSAG06_NODE_2524_length_6725_cov_3.984606_2_plen_116_part_00